VKTASAKTNGCRFEATHPPATFVIVGFFVKLEPGPAGAVVDF